MNQPYKNTIKATIKDLVSIRHDLFTQAINLAMVGELSEVDDVFEVGDVYQFKMEHLENSSDANLALLVELIRKIEKTAESIANLNALDIDALMNEER